MSTQTVELRKVGLAVIKDRKVLMVRNAKHGDASSTLGGKFEADEGDMACLKREVKEEANTYIKLESLQFLGEFRGTILGQENTFITIAYTKASL